MVGDLFAVELIDELIDPFDGARIDQRVGVGGDRLLLGRALSGLGQERAEARGVQVRDRVLRQVALDHARAGLALAQRVDEPGGKAARLAVGRMDAGVDLEEPGGRRHEHEA